MKYRIKEVTLKNWGKIYYPQWSRLWILWGWYIYYFRKITKSSFISSIDFDIRAYSLQEAKWIISDYEKQLEEDKWREEESIKYLDL